jgi:gamma-polyglutamate synthase
MVRKSQVLPFRVAVTGTRGKSGVVRMIYAIMREAGMRVLAKTTGSEPLIIDENGREISIKRKGRTSILEQKNLLRMAADKSVQALITELMSIGPETLSAESLGMIKPHVLVITNVRLDHLDQCGTTRNEIAHCFAEAIPKNSIVFIPEVEMFPVFEERTRTFQSRLISVKSEEREERLIREEIPGYEFMQNIRLALKVSDFLGIERDTAYAAMRKVPPDPGRLRVWRLDLSLPKRTWFLVNAFAANDPESTRQIMDVLRKKSELKDRKWIGLLNLRKDRGSRTQQWEKAIRHKLFPELRRMIFLGDHGEAIRKSLRHQFGAENLFVIQAREGRRIMEKITALDEDPALILGMGNIGQAGASLVEHWERIGNQYDL